MPEPRLRLDRLLAERGLARTRSRAADAIRRGAVTVDGHPATRPAQLVAADADLAVRADGAHYPSRAALKLAAGLDRFGYDPNGLTCLDVGAAAGGFTQVLVERGARRVYAVDVGHGQFDPALTGDPRVVNLEATDARALTRDLIPDAVDLITADVSFISLAKVLPAALALAAPGARLVALVKPQFEVGPRVVGSDGVVRDEDALKAALERVEHWLASCGWPVAGRAASPVAGKAGNTEWLVAAVRADAR